MPAIPFAPDATAVRDAIRAGTTTSTDHVQACLDRIAARDAEVKAWSFVSAETALAQAAARDVAPPVGPLHGVAVGIKDVILTKDMPTQFNSPLYVGNQAGMDAASVLLLRAAGALILGKTDTVEFAATGARAKTCNPHDLTRTPGGSSSGSAAAVADGQVPLALGTQTGGSMIRPASYCGVYGFKPTYGLVSREGVRAFSPSFDTVGWYGRTARDIALLYEVFDPYSAETPVELFKLEGARIAICRSPFWSEAEEGTRLALEAAMDRLRTAGAILVDLDLPPAFDALMRLHKVIMDVEGAAHFLPEYRAFGDRLETSLQAYVENPQALTRAQYLSAYDQAAALRPVFDEIAGAFDLVLTPSSTGEAPPIHGPTGGYNLATGSYVFNGMWTLLHTPCLNVPGLRGPSGLPVGLTLTGPRFSDRKILAAAEAVGAVFAS